MKKLILLFVVFGLAAAFSSCKKEPETEAPEIRETVWNNTHRYIYLKEGVSRDDNGEVQYEEREIDIDVPESDAYLLTLADNGFGHGSANYGLEIYGNEMGWRNFDIIWEILDGTLLIRCLTTSEDWPSEKHCSRSPLYHEYEGLGLVQWYSPRTYWATWTIEEYTADRMVLSTRYEVNSVFWGTEPQFFRFTFEKVGPEEQ